MASHRNNTEAPSLIHLLLRFKSCPPLSNHYCIMAALITLTARSGFATADLINIMQSIKTTFKFGYTSSEGTFFCDFIRSCLVDLFIVG